MNTLEQQIIAAVEPLLINLIVAALGLVLAWIGVKKAQLTGAQTDLAQSEKARTELHHAQDLAVMNVMAAAQNPTLTSNEAMKLSAVQHTTDAVPASQVCAVDALVEAAVAETRDQRASLCAPPASSTESTPTVTPIRG